MSLAALCAGTGWGFAAARGFIELRDGDIANALLAFAVAVLSGGGTIALVSL